MKNYTKYILHGGDTSILNTDNDYFFKEMLDWGRPVKFLAVYFAREKSRWQEAAEQDEKRLKLVGAKAKIELDVAEESTFKEQVRESNVIYLRGGEMKPLAESLKLIGDLDEVFEGKCIGGSSAGAYVLARYYYDSDLDSIKRGFEIIDLNVICHYDTSRKDRLKLLRDKDPKTPILTLPNYKSAIFFK